MHAEATSFGGKFDPELDLDIQAKNLLLIQ
jgi:hypothetical protein